MSEILTTDEQLLKAWEAHCKFHGLDITQSLLDNISISFKNKFYASLPKPVYSDQDMGDFLAWFEQSDYYTYDDDHKKYRKTGMMLKEYTLQDLLREWTLDKLTKIQS